MKRLTVEDYIVDGVNYVMLFLVVILTLYPFYYILINSFNEGLDASMGGIFIWMRKFTLENYIIFFTAPKWINSLYVTLARTLVGTVLSVFFTCMVAYGLSYKNLMLKKFYFTVIIFSMYFSGGLIPYYVLLRSLKLLDNFWVYIIPPALNIFFVLVASSFFRDIPAELMESAYLDGAGEFTVYIRIIIPVSLPLFATMLLFLGVGQWNSWLDSAYFIRTDNLRTLSYRMMEVINQSSFTPTDEQTALFAEKATRATSLSLQMAAMMVATVPIMCVYPFLQKYFIKGIMLGAVKG